MLVYTDTDCASKRTRRASFRKTRKYSRLV